MKTSFLVLASLISIMTSCSSKSNCEAVNNPNCVSTKEINPVCGCDGKDYDNPSLAECAGVSYKLGSCADAADRCTLEPDPGMCRAAIPRFYFDKKENQCKEFIWGGCGGVVPFETLEACKQCSENK
jgi:hypothetical protein